MTTQRNPLRFLSGRLALLLLALALSALPVRAAQPSTVATYATRGEIVSLVVAAEKQWPQTYGGAQVFADVPSGQPGAEAVNIAAAQGVLDRYPCGEPGEPCPSGNVAYFRPAADMTRGDFVKLVSRATNWTLVSTCAKVTFSDVPCGSRYYPYVDAAAAHALLAGYSDGTFRPDEPILQSDVRFPAVGAAPQQVLRQAPQASVANMARPQSSSAPAAAVTPYPGLPAKALGVEVSNDAYYTTIMQPLFCKMVKVPYAIVG